MSIISFPTKSYLELYDAISTGNIEAVKTLINDGININHEEIGFLQDTPLNLAVTLEKKEMIELLLNYGVDIHFKDRNGDTALSNAYLQCNLDIIGILLRAGANVNTQDRYNQTGFHVCARKNQMEIARLLISYNADMNIRDIDGFTPLHIACSPVHLQAFSIKMVKLLLINGANINAFNNNGHTPINHFLANKDFLIPNLELYLFFEFILECSDINKINFNDLLGTAIFEHLKMIIFKHIAKLLAIDIKVDANILDSIVNDTRYHDIFKNCQDELLKAKSTKLGNSWVTYFNLLLGGKRKLKNYAGNTDLVNDFNNYNCLEIFPIYGSSIKENMAKGTKRREAYDKSAVKLSHLLPTFSPTHLIVRDILDCLQTKDLIEFL